MPLPFLWYAFRKMLTMDGANQAGCAMSVQGTGSFEESDAISFHGVESVNPLTGKLTGYPLLVPCLRFDGRGTLILAFPLVPKRPYRNCSALPANGARIYNQSQGEVQKIGNYIHEYSNTENKGEL